MVSMTLAVGSWGHDVCIYLYGNICQDGRTEGKASWRFAHLFRPMYAPRHAGGSGANMGQPSDFLRPLIGEKNERAISLARSRPLDSDLRRSGSASESQLRFSLNHLGLTNLRSHAPRSSKITAAARTSSPPSVSSCLAESRCRFSEMTVCLLSPLEDRSSVESNTTPQQRGRKGSWIIFCCGNKVH